MTKSLTGTRLTRRTFLKSTAAAAGIAALTSVAGCTTIAPTQTTVANTKTYINQCRGNCGGSCPLEATVREGKVIRTTPKVAPAEVREAQLGCVKGHTNPQRLYAAHRVLYPLRQTGERGSDNWERISWDEAFGLIAEKFQSAFDDFGASSVAIWHSFANYGYLGGSRSNYINNPRASGGIGVAQERFLQKTGATIFTPSSDMTALYMQFFGLQYALNSQEDLQNAKTILIWGANPADTMRGAWPFICKAKAAGAKVVTIDPVYTNSAAHSDIWMPVRGGTDSALMLAMANHIIEQDLIDYDYLRNNSVAPLLVKENGDYLRLSDIGMDPVPGANDPATGQPTQNDSPVVYDEATQTFDSSTTIKDPAIIGAFDANGIAVRTVFDIVKESIAQFTLDFAAQECDLPKEQIIEIAELYASNRPSSIVSLWGFEHYANSFHNYKSMTLLGALTGNSGKPGASMLQMSTATAISPTLKNDVSDLFLADAKPSTAMTGEKLVELMDTGKWGGEDFPMRCVYVMNANPLGSGLGRQAVMKAFREVDFTVVADSFMTETAKNASLVLPIAMSWECEDHNGTFMMQKAVEPAGECKNDMDVFRGIAEKMGFPELYDKTDEEYLRAYLDTPENIAAGCGYDNFKENGLIESYKYAESVGVEYNSTGRLQFYQEKVIPRDLYDKEIETKFKVPWYEKAAEAYPGSPVAEKYPLYAMSFHDNYRAHSVHTHLPWLDELHEPTIRIHEDTAEARGIKNGDLVRAYNDRGEVVTKAMLTQGIRPDTVLLPHGFHEDEFVKGHVQDLTLLALDPMTSNNNFNDALCEIELYEGGVQ